ncbi:hypothetical protein EYZ11_002044 [Aspergillus tanneri]|uniref:D-arabinono-1,4-lactone oxidase n=1 Tax=Aspergillus tanneri TaxID=1220188 RepID=A0A4S3JRP1_9EURO|nr:uncharacterized protein ATNIH1004_007312 [Aspergillus tanneri]KAA8645891.1 hypothetical protein ATNIH1004_007312 [Aspergillus tanneri]THC98459.1 hypothetical protein EYZ11_002044 [Aspergillus tanneri]
MAAAGLLSVRGFLLLVFLNAVTVSAYRWYNWQFATTCESTRHIVPDDEADLAAFVKQQYPQRDSYIISLTNLKNVTIHDNNTVTFGAGWDLVDLIPMLRSHNLQPLNLGTERVQNFIGAFTPGTHGTGKNLGNIATHVIGFRVMDATGKIHKVDHYNQPEELKAFRISLGALGLITEVTIQVEPISYLKRTTELIPASPNFTQLYTDVYDYYQKYDRMMVWGPHMDWDPINSNWKMESNLTITYWENSTDTGVYNCSTNYCANGCGDCERPYVCYDVATEAISTPPQGVCSRSFYAEIEHFFPVEDFVEGATNYTNFQLSQTPRMKDYNNHQMVYELRFVKGDDTWMSPVNTYNLGPEHSGIFAVIEIDWYATYNNYGSLWFYQTLAQEFIPEFGHIYNVHSHWNKMLWFNKTYAEYIYPELEKFLIIQERMDPHCQFVNEFLVNSLGINRCRGICPP